MEQWKSWRRENDEWITIASTSPVGRWLHIHSSPARTTGSDIPGRANCHNAVVTRNFIMCGTGERVYVHYTYWRNDRLLPDWLMAMKFNHPPRWIHCNSWLISAEMPSKVSDFYALKDSFHEPIVKTYENGR